MMKIEALLDTPAILANQAAPVHMLVRFNAPETENARENPIAFAAVIDRSGSMEGTPLEAAKRAAGVVARNLRKNDEFCVVVFDSEAQVVVPLQRPGNRAGILQQIQSIEPGGSTNLTGGWMLGRDELQKSDPKMPRKLLLLSDGMLNTGITEPEMVRRIVGQGLERSQIRTSSLGFGPDYDEQLLAKLASTTGGTFYDANSPDKLAEIFSAELDGLQSIAAQNVRLRIKPLDFCERMLVLADSPAIELPDGRLEVAVGDLVGGEERMLVVLFEVLPIPLLPDGSPAATLEGEALVELEVAYDLIEEIGVSSHTWKQTMRIKTVQDPAEVIRNGEVIPWVAQQRAGRAVEQALESEKRGRVDEARATLKTALDQLQNMGESEAVHEARRFVEQSLNRLEEDGAYDSQFAKYALYSSSARRRMSSAQHWSAEEAEPEFLKNWKATQSRNRRPRRDTGDKEESETTSGNDDA